MTTLSCTSSRPHNRSLGGILKPFIDTSRPAPTDEEIDAAIEAGFAEDFRAEEEQIRADWIARKRASTGQ